ncbi:MAG TPA: hypothetical protein VNG90_04325 [Candidatus Acidoferrum sp.]|nr:hypothetical protein [Candidatus Acidoferrum sp.]
MKGSTLHPQVQALYDKYHHVFARLRHLRQYVDDLQQTIEAIEVEVSLYQELEICLRQVDTLASQVLRAESSIKRLNSQPIEGVLDCGQLEIVSNALHIGFLMVKIEVLAKQHPSESLYEFRQAMVAYVRVFESWRKQVCATQPEDYLIALSDQRFKQLLRLVVASAEILKKHCPSIILDGRWLYVQFSNLKESALAT